MANRYCNLEGSNLIKNEFNKINIGFDGLQNDIDSDAEDLNNLEEKVNNLSFTGSEHDPLVTSSLIDSEGEDFGQDGTATGLDGRLSKWEKKINQSAYDPKSFGAKYDGVTDDTQSLLDCISAVPIGGQMMISGVLRFTQSIIINKLIHIIGLNSNVYAEVEYRAKSCLLKDGNFNGIILDFEGSTIEDIQIDGVIGNGGCGLVIGDSRIKVKNVTTTNHGNHGIDIGSMGSNWNVWYMQNIISLNNGGYGVNIDDVINANANCNAGCLINADLRDNVGGGLCLGKTIDSAFINICSQLNGGIGVELKSGAKGNQFFGTYTESNTGGEIVLQSGADNNYVFGYRSGVNSDGISDNGAGNLILGRDSQVTNYPPFFKSPIDFKELIINDPTISGCWRLYKNSTDRALEVLFDGASNTPVFMRIKHNNSGKIRFSVDEILIGASNVYLKGIQHKDVSLNFGTIGANSTKELTTALTGCVVGNLVIATFYSLPAGVIFAGANISTVDTIAIRLANITGADVVVGSISWSIDVWQH